MHRFRSLTGNCTYIDRLYSLAFDQRQKRPSIVFGSANSLKSSHSRDCLSGPRDAAQHGDPFHWHCRWQIARAAYSEVRDHSKHRLRRAIRRLERDSVLLHSNQLTSTSVERWRRRRANQLHIQKSPWWHPRPSFRTSRCTPFRSLPLVSHPHPPPKPSRSVPLFTRGTVLSPQRIS